MRALLLALLAVPTLVATGATAHAAANDCPTDNRPNKLVIVGGSLQIAQLGKPFGRPFSVALANSNGCPLTGNLAGVTIHFDAPGSGASGIFPSAGSTQTYAATDAQGMATSPAFTANDTAGSYTVDAESDYGRVDIPVSNTAAGLASAVAVVGANVDQAPTGTLYASQLQARVADANGNPVQGAAVTFTVVPGATGAGATFLGPTQATTGSDGVATAPPLLANGVAGAFMVTASTDGIPSIATFTLENLQTYDSLTAATGARTAHAGGRYAPLVVHVADASGHPVQGAAVSFSVDSVQGGAGATFAGGAAQASATTDASGVASSPSLVAGKVAGRFSIVASTPTARGALTFAFRVLPGKPATLAAGAASGESTTVGTRFPMRLAVTVTDADGNVVPRTRVTFVAPERGPSARFGRRYRVTVRTDEHGIAVAPALVANRKAGGYAVKAVAGGKSTAFALVNLPKP